MTRPQVILRDEQKVRTVTPLCDFLLPVGRGPDQVGVWPPCSEGRDREGRGGWRGDKVGEGHEKRVGEGGRASRW